MAMVASPQRVASASLVLFGRYGDATRHARQRGVCRQWLCREASSLPRALARQQRAVERLHSRLRDLEQRLSDCQVRLRAAVVLGAEGQARFASVAQACGVSLPTCRGSLDVPLAGQRQSAPTPGRATRAAGKRARELLPVLDAAARRRAAEVAADEVHVKRAVLMTVEPGGPCRPGGRLSGEVSGGARARELAALPDLGQVTRDGGTGSAKGVELLNAQRKGHGQPAVVDQGGHYRALRGGGVGLRQAEAQARRALAEAEAADKEVAARGRHGQGRAGPAVRAGFAWKEAERAMGDWRRQGRPRQRTKEPLRLFTPAGGLNTRRPASAAPAGALPRSPAGAFAKVKRSAQKPEMLNYLERVRQQIEALPFPEEVKQAAVQQGGLRRRPESLRGESSQAAARRGALLPCAVVLSKAGEAGQQAAAAVRDVLRRAQRAGSLVECVNGALRMRQARRRKVAQGLPGLKRLYWNCHTCRGGRRRGSTPYERPGVCLPEGLRWWALLKLTPEQLRDKLSAAARAA